MNNYQPANCLAFLKYAFRSGSGKNSDKVLADCIEESRAEVEDWAESLEEDEKALFWDGGFINPVI